MKTDPNADLIGYTFDAEDAYGRSHRVAVTGTWDLLPGYVTVEGDTKTMIRQASIVRRSKQIEGGGG